MKRKMWLWVGAAVAVSLAGCATNRYVGPTSGRSGAVQVELAGALEAALGRIDWSPLAGRKTAFTVATLTEGFGARSAEERYLKEALVQKALAAGATPVVKGPPEVEVRVLAKALGTVRIRRDFILLYYAELLEGLADLEVSFYRAEGERRVLLRSQSASARTYQRDWYLFYMIGPFTKRWQE